MDPHNVVQSERHGFSHGMVPARPADAHQGEAPAVMPSSGQHTDEGTRPHPGQGQLRPAVKAKPGRRTCVRCAVA